MENGVAYPIKAEQPFDLTLNEFESQRLTLIRSSNMNFSIYWQHADAVSKTLYFILLAMSIATWTVFILRLMGTRQLKQQAYAQLSQAITSLKAKLQSLSFEQRKSSCRASIIASDFC